MLYDLGLNSAMADIDAFVNSKISEVDQVFDLVMVSERFDESLVLLKELMGWPLDVVTSLKLNAQTKKTFLSEEARKELASWLKQDYKLYHHFTARFEEAVKDFGEENMARELDNLAKANEATAKRCGFEAKPNSQLKGDFKLYGKDTLGYSVGNASSASCRLYGTAEMRLLDLARKKQGERAVKELKRQGRLEKADSYSASLGATDDDMFNVIKSRTGAAKAKLIVHSLGQGGTVKELP